MELLLISITKVEENQSSECSVNLDYSDVPVTLTLNVDAESHRYSNEALSESLSRFGFTLVY